VWDVRTGELLQEITGVGAEVSQVEFGSNENTLFALSEDARIVAWDVRSGNPLKDIRSVAGIRALVFSPDGSLLAVGSTGNVQVLSVEDKRLLQVFDNPAKSELRDLRFHPDGATLAVLYSNRLDIIDIKSGEVLGRQASLPGEGARSISRFTWSPDGKLLALGWKDGKVALFDSYGGQLVLSFQPLCMYGRVMDLGFSPDGERLAATLECVTAIWDVESGGLLQAIGDQTQGDTNSWSADGSMIASIGLYSDLWVWDAATGEQLFYSPNNSYAGKSIAWAPVKPIFSFTDGSARILIWNASTKEARELSLPNETFWTSGWSIDGALLAASTPKGVTIWDTSTWKLFQKLDVFGTSQLRFSPDGRFLVTGSWFGVPSLWGLSY